MYFSVTEVQSFKRCRRQWHYGSFNGLALTPIIQPKPYLDLGTMVHKTLAYWTECPDLGTHEDGSPRTLQQVFMVIAAEQRRTVIEQYTNATGMTPSTEELEPLMDAVVMGSAMMANYETYYREPLPARLKFCNPEQEVLIPIPGTEHPCTKCDARGVYVPASNVKFQFAGVVVASNAVQCDECSGTGTALHFLKARLDALAADRRDNVYVVERKTYENRPNLKLLEVNDQFIGYLWVAQQLDIGRVIGIAYDGMWKRATPPQRPKRLEIADLFCRTLITPSQSMIDEYGVELAEVVKDMANDPLIYKNRVWQGCWDCSFEQLCRAQSEGDDTDFIISREYMRRTEEDSSDIVQTVESAAMMR